MENNLSKNDELVNNNHDEYQFLIDEHHLFDQPKAIKLWFEKVAKTKNPPAFYFPNQNSCTYWKKKKKTLKGVNYLKTKNAIYAHFKNLHLVSKEKKLDFTIDDLKSCIGEKVVPTHFIDKKLNLQTDNLDKKIVKLEKKANDLQKKIKKNPEKIISKNNNDNLITFEEIWDEIGDLESGIELLETIEKDLVSSIHKNLSKDVAPFVKDNVGDPFLEFPKHNHRVLQTDFDTDEINDAETVELIAELATIFDKRAELLKDENGKRSVLGFTTSADRISNKVRGYDIFNILREKGIKISLFNDLSQINFNTVEKNTAKAPNLPNTTFITTVISTQTKIMITYGNKEYNPPKNIKYKAYIEEHAKKVVNIIERNILIGRPIKS